MPVGRGDGVKSVAVGDGYFVLSPVSLASRDQDGGPVGINDHGKIGDCEQSTPDAEEQRNKRHLLYFSRMAQQKLL